MVDDASRLLYVSIGQRLAELRARKGLRQADLATTLGLSRAAVANMEAGNQSIAVHTLLKLGRLLSASPLDLVPELSSEPSVRVSLGRSKRLAELTSDLDGDKLAWVEDIVGSVEGGVVD